MESHVNKAKTLEPGAPSRYLPKTKLSFIREFSLIQPENVKFEAFDSAVQPCRFFNPGYERGSRKSLETFRSQIPDSQAREAKQQREGGDQGFSAYLHGFDLSVEILESTAAPKFSMREFRLISFIHWSRSALTFSSLRISSILVETCCSDGISSLAF